MKRLIIEKSDDEFYTSHSGLALAGLCINRYSDLSSRIGRAMDDSNNVISQMDIIRSYIGLLCLGKSDFEALAGMREDEYFRHAMGIETVPSVERLRQRMDETASVMTPLMFKSSVAMLRRANVPITSLPTGHIPLDIDVFPQDNSGTKKKGVSRTYKGHDGYAPVGAYLGQEGWCLEVELRPGKQHSQAEFVPFLRRVLGQARKLTKSPLLVRLDSAHDALDNLAILNEERKVSYIIKWNPRRQDHLAWHKQAFAKGKIQEPRPGKRIALLTVNETRVIEGKNLVCTRLMRVTERTIDKHGQKLLVPEIALEGWWHNLVTMPAEKIIRLYNDHGTSEQFHSEFKTDLDLERLPSGKFATNALVMAMGVFAYNILRMIGQLGLLGEYSPVRHPAKRRRLRTVIQELMYMAGRLVRTGHRLLLRFGKHCPSYDAFNFVYNKLAPA